MGIDNGFFIKIRFCSLLKSECQDNKGLKNVKEIKILTLEDM